LKVLPEINSHKTKPPSGGFFVPVFDTM